MPSNSQVNKIRVKSVYYDLIRQVESIDSSTLLSMNDDSSLMKVYVDANEDNVYVASHSDIIKIAGDEKTLTEKMTEIDELHNKMLYTNLLTDVTTGTRSTNYITVSYDSENDATTFHCVYSGGGYRAWINLPSGLVVGRQYKVVFDYTTNSTETVYVKISNNAANNDITNIAATTFTKGSGRKEILFTMASGIVHINIASLDIGKGNDVVLSRVKVYDMSDVYNLREITDKIDKINEDVETNSVAYDKEEVILGAASDLNMGPTSWYGASTHGTHVAIPIADLGGVGATIAISMTMFDYAAFVSSYPTPVKDGPIHFVSDEVNVRNNVDTRTYTNSRLNIWSLESKGYHYMTIPTTASHLIVNVVAGNGSATGVKVYKVSEIAVTEFLGYVAKKDEVETQIEESIAAATSIYDTTEQIDISGYEILDRALAPRYSGVKKNWWSPGKHIKIPIADVGKAGDWIGITCNAADSFIGFFDDYSTVENNDSPVHYVNETVKVYNSLSDSYTEVTADRVYFSNGTIRFVQIPEGTEYLIVCVVNGNGVNVGAKLYKTAIINARSAVQGLLANEDITGAEYGGEKISLVKHYAKVTRLFKTPAGQATWYYNGYFFNCHLKERNGTIISKFRLYQPNGTTLGEPVSEWDMESVVGFGYNGTDGVHANSIQLLNFKYANTDEFPIFTIENNNGAAYGYTFVMRLYYDNSQWNLVKLYNVIYPNSENTGGDKRIALHAFEDGTLYSYAGDFWNVLNGTHYIELYDKTKKITTDMTTDLVLTAEDRIGQIETGFSRMHVYQAAFHFGNKLYQLDGDSWSYFHPESTASNKNNSTPNNYRNLPHLMVFDFTIEKCVNDILLNEAFGIPDAEPEGICIVDGKMYISQNGENNDGYMYEIEFD